MAIYADKVLCTICKKEVNFVDAEDIGETRLSEYVCHWCLDEVAELAQSAVLVEPKEEDQK